MNCNGSHIYNPSTFSRSPTPTQSSLPFALASSSLAILSYPRLRINIREHRAPWTLYAHASSVDCIISVDFGFIVDNLALHVLFYHIRILLKSNYLMMHIGLQKLLYIYQLRKSTLRYVIPSRIQDLFAFYNQSINQSINESIISVKSVTKTRDKIKQ